MMPWVEVIGLPIGHSLSPITHRYWLEVTGIYGVYESTAVAAPDLASFVADQRTDSSWRGCNVTAPHKQAMVRLLDRLDPLGGRAADRHQHWR